jgi:hypothetical protein
MMRGRPRKNGQRERNGRLKRKPQNLLDRGNEYAIRQRASLVGNGYAHDPRAGYPLGVLMLQGAIETCEHDAGLRYALLSTIVWGNGRTPPSSLANLIPSLPDADRQPSEPAQREAWRARKRTELDKAVARVRELPTSRPFRVLEDVVVYEHRPRFLGNGIPRQTRQAMQADIVDANALCAALSALAELWGLREA